MSEKISKEEKVQLETLEAYKRALGSPFGKKMLHDLMAKFHVRNTSVGYDAYDTYFKEGQRSVILHILGHLQLEPNEFKDLLMQKGAEHEIF